MIDAGYGASLLDMWSEVEPCPRALYFRDDLGGRQLGLAAG